jgi:hypothetical protein
MVFNRPKLKTWKRGLRSKCGDEIMNMPILTEMEDNIRHLSLAEQLWLMERLVQRIKENTINEKSRFESDLIAMANDPQIQRELRVIEEEFAFAEADGLDIS